MVLHIYKALYKCTKKSLPSDNLFAKEKDLDLMTTFTMSTRKRKMEYCMKIVTTLECLTLKLIVKG